MICLRVKKPRTAAWNLIICFVSRGVGSAIVELELEMKSKMIKIPGGVVLTVSSHEFNEERLRLASSNTIRHSSWLEY